MQIESFSWFKVFRNILEDFSNNEDASLSLMSTVVIEGVDIGLQP
jgi:hypothetical protein